MSYSFKEITKSRGGTALQLIVAKCVIIPGVGPLEMGLLYGKQHEIKWALSYMSTWLHIMVDN